MKICQEQVELMKAAYEYMYIIENTLRQVIQMKMTEDYGIHWQFVASRKYINSITNKDFKDLNYHELVSYCSIFPELVNILPQKSIPQLHRLTPIRNKIAHNHTITSKEFTLLYDVCQNIQFKIESFAI